MAFIDRLREDLRREASPPTSDPQLRSVGRYLLKRKLGHGGMGVVFEAEDPLLQRRVAVKLMRDDFADTASIKRLHREAMIAAQLKHPNIVAVHEVGLEPDGEGYPRHFIAMDLVEGPTLADRLRDRPGPDPDLLRILQEVSGAVAYAHEQGVIHRDIKPANVLLDSNGQAYLSDFGLARGEMFATALTRSDAMLGTPAYMAPEQMDRKWGAVGPPSDVYALGVILYEILTGVPPFQNGTVAGLVAEVQSREPVPPGRRCKATPRDVETICLKALEKEPARRYATAKEFQDDLGRFRRGEPILARSPSWPYRWKKRLAKRGTALAILGAGLLLVSLLAAFLVPRWLQERTQRRQAQEQLRREGERRVAMEELGNLWMRLVLAKRLLHNGANEPEKVQAEIRQEVDSVRSYLTRHGNYPEGYYVLAWGHFYLDELTEAEAALRSGLPYGEPSAPAAALLARIKVTQYQYSLFGDPCSHDDRRTNSRPLLEEAFAWSDRARRVTTPWPLPRTEEDQVGETLIEAYRISENGDGREKALAFLREANDRRETAEICNLIGIWSDRREGIEWQTRALKCMPLYSQAFIDRAWARLRLDESYAEIVEDYDRAIRISPRNGIAYALRADGRIRRGGALRGSGREPEAMEEFRKAMEDAEGSLERRPGAALGYWCRGSCRYELGDCPGALQDLSRALEIEPFWIEVHVIRAQVFMKMGDPHSALRELPFEAYPTCLIAYCIRSDALWRLGEFEEAIRGYDAALRFRQHRVPYNNRGALRRELGYKFWLEGKGEEALRVSEEAIRDLDRAIELDPNRFQPYENRALVHHQIASFLFKSESRQEGLKRVLEAIEDYSHALSINPQLVVSLIQRGSCYLDLAPMDRSGPSQCLAKARADLTEAQKIAPPDSPDRVRIADLLRKLAEMEGR